MDSLVLTNNNVIVGELKDMSKGVAVVETDYSDSDFKIEWEKIAYLKTESIYQITLSDGSRYTGKLLSEGDGTINIINLEEGETNVTQDELVNLNSIDFGFWSRLSANIEVGYSVTKANNLQQWTTRAGIGYNAERWNLRVNYNTLRSTQDEVDDIRRTDAGITGNYLLPKDYYVLANVSFLSNTEQLIDLRTTINTGIGKYIIHTNQSYWGVKAGLNYNIERFEDSSQDRESWEGFVGSELDLYDIGDLTLKTSVVAFPGITESGRWRTDFNFDAKYEFPLDFYLKLGFTLNYDNQPVEGASETDYVFVTTFGWEW
jgi:putative salt-induced outer membrane protein YdiY